MGRIRLGNNWFGDSERRLLWLVYWFGRSRWTRVRESNRLYRYSVRCVLGHLNFWRKAFNLDLGVTRFHANCTRPGITSKRGAAMISRIFQVNLLDRMDFKSNRR